MIDRWKRVRGAGEPAPPQDIPIRYDYKSFYSTTMVVVMSPREMVCSPASRVSSMVMTRN